MENPSAHASATVQSKSLKLVQLSCVQSGPNGVSGAVVQKLVEKGPRLEREDAMVRDVQGMRNRRRIAKKEVVRSGVGGESGQSAPLLVELAPGTG